MKSKLSHLFFASLTGIIFLLTYLLIIYWDYEVIFRGKKILLYVFYALFFGIGVFAYYYFQKNSITKRFIRIFPICMLVFFLFKHSYSVYSYYKYLVSYREMPKELRKYDLLDNKEIHQRGKIISPISQSKIPADIDLFLDKEGHLFIYYKFYDDETTFYIDCILKYDTEGNHMETLYLENFVNQKRDILVREKYLIDIYEKSYSSFLIDGNRDFLPMEELKREEQPSEKDMEERTFKNSNNNLIVIIQKDSERDAMVIIKKENKLYYFYTQEFYYLKYMDFPVSDDFNLFNDFIKPPKEKGIAPQESPIKYMYYLKKYTSNSGLHLFGKEKSFQEDWSQGYVYFNLILDEQELHLKTFYSQNLFSFNQTSDDIRYYENQNETLEIHNNIRLYRNKYLSYYLLSTGYQYYLIKNKF